MEGGLDDLNPVGLGKPLILVGHGYHSTQEGPTNGLILG
jgi:hypothetical protein